MLTASRTRASILFFLLAATLNAAEVKGVVLDPNGAAVMGAQVAAVNGGGVIVSQITGDQGDYDFNVSPLFENVELRVSAAGYQTVTGISVGGGTVRLQLSPQQPDSGVSRITSQDLRDRNEAQVVDLMREMPGMVITQAGSRGSTANLYVRGGDADDNLVLLNGIPINSFYTGGLFDFGQVPADAIEEVTVARGPQSPVYGSYATGSVVSFTTRSPDNGPALDVVAEGGSHDENRFGISGSGLAHGWGIAGSVSSLLDNGPVADSSYRNDNVFLSGEHRWYTQSLFVFGNFNSNNYAAPGPYPSTYDEKNNTSTYGLHYQDDFTPNVRLDITSGFYLNNSSLDRVPDKDIRVYGDGRGTFKILKFWTLQTGYSFTREELRTSETTLFGTILPNVLPLRRDDQGVYIDNQFVFAKKFFLNAGGREEIYQYLAGPTTRFNLRLSGGYVVSKDLRLHIAYGTAFRPPSGVELEANPKVRPERTESYSVGVQEMFLKNKVSVDGTWFHNRYQHLIESLTAPFYVNTANVGNALAEGAEFSAKVRMATWWSLTGNYTWLESYVLSLPAPDFYYGEPLLRRPKQSGSAVASVIYGNFSINAVGYVRNWDLDLAANGTIERLGGDLNLGLNVNYQVRSNLMAYVNVKNALDRRYEEAYGFPAPLLNFVVGMKWSLARAR